MIITTAWLKEHGACADQVELFGRTFGDGGTMTPTAIEAAAAAGLDLDWFADRVLSSPALAEYQRARAPALAEYRRAIAPALDEYDLAIAPARAEYRRIAATAEDEYLRAMATAWADFRRVTAHVLAEYERAKATALIGLLWPEAAGEGGDE